MKTRRPFDANPSPSAPSGFTLIELLVVIAMIAILAAMILPALARAKQKAKGIACINNMKQLQTAWYSYASEADDTVPLNINYTQAANVGAGTAGSLFPNWVAGNMQSSTEKNNSALLDDPDLTYGSLGASMKAFAVFKCPGDISDNVRSCSMNGWVGPGGATGTLSSKPIETGSTQSKFVSVTKTTDMRKLSPVNTFVFLDENITSISDGWLYVDTGGYNPVGTFIPSFATYADLPAVYHNGSSSFSFGDGHAENHKWTGAVGSLPVNPGATVLTDPALQKDFGWLLTHATVLK